MRAIKSLTVNNLSDGTTYNEIVIETTSGIFISLSENQWNELNSTESNNSILYQDTYNYLISLGVTPDEISALTGK